MDRSIVFVQIPSFEIAVERACQPRLVGRPLAVAPSCSGRGLLARPDSARALVQAVSSEARQAGIRPGMRANEALRLCQDLGLLYPNPPLYARAEAAVLRLLNRYTPCVEPGRGGSAYLDITSTLRLFGGAVDIAARAEREISEELRLIPSAGLGSNKLVSGVAGRQSAPLQFIEVLAGGERSFLAPLKVRVLPAVDRPALEKLGELNVQLVRQLTEVTPAHLELALGRKGLLLYRQAHGQDYSPVRPPSAVPHVSRRSELAEDSNDLAVLKAELFYLVDECLAELRHRGRSARTLQIDLLYSDLKSARGVRKLRRAANQLSGWYGEAEALLLQILTRRIRVRAIEVRFEDFASDPSAQLGLFEDRKKAKEIVLTAALDHLKDRFGKEAVYYARAG